jgi:inosine/xanthosine triphosphatase
MHQKTQTIVIGSENPVKLEAARRAFSRVFPEMKLHTVTCKVASGVASQPQGDDEALSGALNRARAASTQVPAADFFVGIEGAVADTADGMKAFAWVVVLSEQLLGKGRTATFYLPEAVAQRVRNGGELGDVMDAFFGTKGAKRNEGAIGLLTRGILCRTDLYEQGIIAALIPFI